MISLTVAHNIFLSKKDRYSLAREIKSIVIKGISVPIWNKDSISGEPAPEIFCDYEITNKDKEVFVSYTKSMYAINIPEKKCIDLLDVKDGGECGIMMSHHDKVKVGKKLVDVIHYISIQDEERVRQSIENSKISILDGI